ncbi:MAG: hypothetical protein ACFE94_12955 [Candidatus Hodarchaeota archaeon]
MAEEEQGEEVSSELREKIDQNIGKVFEKWLDRISKGEPIEGIIKALIVEKVMNILGILTKRTVVKKVTKKIVKRRVDKYWERNRKEILEKIKNL